MLNDVWYMGRKSAQRRIFHGKAFWQMFSRFQNQWNPLKETLYEPQAVIARFSLQNNWCLWNLMDVGTSIQMEVLTNSIKYFEPTRSMQVSITTEFNYIVSIINYPPNRIETMTRVARQLFTRSATRVWPESGVPTGIRKRCGDLGVRFIRGMALSQPDFFQGSAE